MFGKRRRLGQGIVLRVVLVVGVLIASTTLVATPAEALDQVTIIRSWQTGQCIDSNHSGRVYMLGCNGGDYQRWHIRQVDGDHHTIQNVATGRCLDSDHSGAAYTSPCHGGNWQQWATYFPSGWWGAAVTKFRNRETNRCLDGDNGSAYTNFCGQNNVWQNWKRGF